MTDSHDRLESFVDRFQRSGASADSAMILHGGDLSDHGTLDEFQRARAALDRTGVPVVTTAGNHDVGFGIPMAQKEDNLKRFEQIFGSANSAHDFEGARVLVLNNGTYTINEETFAWLERELQAAEGKPKLVAMHIPALGPDASTESGRAFLRQQKALGRGATMPNQAQVERFTELMARHKVDVVLSGHTHRPYEVLRDGVRYVTVGSQGGKIRYFGGTHQIAEVMVQDGKLVVQTVALDTPLHTAPGVAVNKVKDKVETTLRPAKKWVRAHRDDLPGAVLRKGGELKGEVGQAVRDQGHRLVEAVQGGLEKLPGLARRLLRH